MNGTAQVLDLFDTKTTSLDIRLTECPRNRCDLQVGDARQLLSQIPDGHFDCIVTSPPYWGLRDYSVAGQIGAETTVDEYIADLVRLFSEARRTLSDDGTLWLNMTQRIKAAPWTIGRQLQRDSNPKT